MKYNVLTTHYQYELLYQLINNQIKLNFEGAIVMIIICQNAL